MRSKGRSRLGTTTAGDRGLRIEDDNHHLKLEVVMKVFLIILVLLYGGTSVVASPVASTAYDQKRKDDKGKKSTPGPPVVRDKGKDDKHKDPPKRGKKPD